MSLLIAAIIMQLLDAITLVQNYAQYGWAAEGNSIIQGLDLDRALFFKAFMILFMLVWTARCAVRWYRTAFVFLSIYLIAGIVGAVTNLKIVFEWS